MKLWPPYTLAMEPFSWPQALNTPCRAIPRTACCTLAYSWSPYRLGMVKSSLGVAPATGPPHALDARVNGNGTGLEAGTRVRPEDAGGGMGATRCFSRGSIVVAKVGVVWMS